METSNEAAAVAAIARRHRGLARKFGDKNRPVRIIVGGSEGRTYPGNFEPEIEKNTSGTSSQITENKRTSFRIDSSSVSRRSLLMLRTVRQQAAANIGSHGSIIRGSTMR